MVNNQSSYPRAKNPFDDFPITSRDQDDTQLELSEWRERWETYIGDMLYVAEQAIKWGHVEVHEGDPTTFTVHCSPTTASDET